MNIIKNFNTKKIIMILVIFVLLIVIYLFVDYKVNFLKRVVFDRQNEWDVTLLQNTKLTGNYMGEIYNQDYTFNNLPADLFSVLISNYYTMNSEDFFAIRNNISTGYFQKTVSKKEIEKFSKKLFGKNSSLSLVSVNYACGGLTINNDKYTISSYEPEYCGIYTSTEDYYISDITNYYKENGNIIVEKKVAYVSPNIISEEDGEINYEVYEDKTKNKLIDASYNPECLFEEKRKEECYENFKTYKITLKKGNWNHYYFDKIEKK